KKQQRAERNDNHWHDPENRAPKESHAFSAVWSHYPVIDRCHNLLRSPPVVHFECVIPSREDAKDRERVIPSREDGEGSRVCHPEPRRRRRISTDDSFAS